MPAPTPPADPSKWPCCGVVAVAALAGVSFPVAWEVLGRGRAHNWRGRTMHHMRLDALTELGFRHNTVAMFTGVTLSKFALSCRPGRAYMVAIRGHVVVVCDDMVLDQDGILPADLHPARRARVKAFTVILEW